MTDSANALVHHSAATLEQAIRIAVLSEVGAELLSDIRKDTVALADPAHRIDWCAI